MALYKENERLEWAYDGQKVIVQCGESGRVFRGVILEAMGFHARVMPINGKYSNIYEIWRLFPDDGRVPENHKSLITDFPG